jgi:hypothetical protein
MAIKRENAKEILGINYKLSGSFVNITAQKNGVLRIKRSSGRKRKPKK